LGKEEQDDDGEPVERPGKPRSAIMLENRCSCLP